MFSGQLDNWSINSVNLTKCFQRMEQKLIFGKQIQNIDDFGCLIMTMQTLVYLCRASINFINKAE